MNNSNDNKQKNVAQVFNSIVANVSGHELVDALPYVDYYDSELKAGVEALVAQEMKRFTPPDYLAGLEAARGTSSVPVANSYATTLAEDDAERQRVEDGRPMEGVGDSLETDVATLLPSKKRRGERGAWQPALKRVRLESAYEELEALNGELLMKYGQAAWHVHIKRLEELRDHLHAQVEVLREQCKAVNDTRKTEHQRAQEKLSILENDYLEIATKCAELAAINQELRLKANQS